MINQNVSNSCFVFGSPQDHYLSASTRLHYKGSTAIVASKLTRAVQAIARNSAVSTAMHSGLQEIGKRVLVSEVYQCSVDGRDFLTVAMAKSDDVRPARPWLKECSTAHVIDSIVEYFEQTAANRLVFTEPTNNEKISAAAIIGELCQAFVTLAPDVKAAVGRRDNELVIELRCGSNKRFSANLVIVSRPDLSKTRHVDPKPDLSFNELTEVGFG